MYLKIVKQSYYFPELPFYNMIAENLNIQNLKNKNIFLWLLVCDIAPDYT